jgi:hypothetical protein
VLSARLSGHPVTTYSQGRQEMMSFAERAATTQSMLAPATTSSMEATVTITSSVESAMTPSSVVLVMTSCGAMNRTM